MYGNKFNNLNEMDRFPENQKLSKFNHEEIDNLSNPCNY